MVWRSGQREGGRPGGRRWLAAGEVEAQQWGGPRAILWTVPTAAGAVKCPRSLVHFPQPTHSSHSCFWLHRCRGPHLAPGGTLIRDSEKMEA